MICGGVDDFTEEGSAEFANMKATSNSETELAQGRSPAEMSRPTTSTRAGFMEAQGSGVQIVMQAKLAVEMGCPIYGVIGLTNTAMDKEGRSVPAPGQGILSTAREIKHDFPSQRLNLSYRRRQLDYRKKQIAAWVEYEHENLDREANEIKDPIKSKSFVIERMAIIELEVKRQQQEALEMWGTGNFKNDPTISPLRGALATFGLNIDDVGVVSFHGTSTTANDKNESEVTNKQLIHLGRTRGNGCPVIAQKWLTGHPKGAAAAWMTNGLIQTILSGIIPGNRNADNISPELEKFDLIFFPSKSIQTDGIKAGILKSFGFGQVGGEALLIHPEYLLSSLDKKMYAEYSSKHGERWKHSYRQLQDAMVHENLVKLKNSAPYSPELESPVLLNPLHRAQKGKSGEYSFKEYESPLAKTAETLLGEGNSKGVGIDTEMMSALALDNPTFVNRNFTGREIEECKNKPDPVASFTGRWSAKEAVVKAISSFAGETTKKTKESASAPLKDIEVLSNSNGVPIVKLSGNAKLIGDSLNIGEIKVSISHSESYVVAIAIASAAEDV
jgi:phosphopantetheine--protein transferase-like protein